jgi:glycerol-3-phosphate cytidylyltransferase-like family protein
VKSFQDEQFRMKVVSSLKAVDRVILSIDAELTEDGEIPVSKTLDKVFTQIQEMYHGYVNIVFTKG